MNENEIERIAAAVNALRPDWPTASLRTLLNNVGIVRRPRRDVAVALTWVACDKDTRTPARVLEAGPWWQAAAADVPAGERTYRPPKREEACPLHLAHYRDNCAGCEADRKAGDPVLTVTTRPLNPERVRAKVDQARAALRPNIEEES